MPRTASGLGNRTFGEAGFATAAAIASTVVEPDGWERSAQPANAARHK
jgi:hypothetical protein